MTDTSQLRLALQAMETTILEALRDLSEQNEETPLEAAEHLQAIIVGAVTGRAEFASMYDRALVNPRLYRDLKSDLGHQAVGSRWGETEQAVRRTRRKFREMGMLPTPAEL